MSNRAFVIVLAVLLLASAVVAIDPTLRLIRTYADGTLKGDCGAFDFYGFGGITKVGDTCQITKPDDHLPIGDVPGELYLIVPRSLILGFGNGVAISTTGTDGTPILWPISGGATFLKVCFWIKDGAMTINIKRDDGSPANILSSNLAGLTTTNPSTGTGCTTTFVSGESGIAVGEKATLSVVGTPTATQAVLFWDFAYTP